MKKSSVLLAVLGLAVLTGCKNEVMQPRSYVPAEDEKAIAGNRRAEDFDQSSRSGGEVPPPAPLPAAPAQAPVQAPAPAAAFAPMENVKSSGGITGKAASRRRRSGKAVSGTAAKGGVYIVKAGDYPERIARKFKVRLSELLKANNLTPESSRRLQIGQKLVIPGGKSAAYSSRRSGKRTAAAATAGKGYYIVQSGDYPERIARKNKVRLSELLKANNLTPESSRRLQIGQKLVIPGAGTVAAPAGTDAAPAATVQVKPAETAADRPAADTTAAQEKPAETTPARVEQADALSRELESTSPAASGNSGASATVSSELTYISEDTTIQELAAKYKTTVNHLRSLNENNTSDTVSKGSYFFVPSQK